MTIKILRVFDIPDSRSPGPIQVARVVQFEVDGYGPVHVEVPLVEFESEPVRRAIEAEAEKVRGLLRGF